MENNNELNLNEELNLDEMEEVSGGRGGSRKPLPAKSGYIVYQIQKGDMLGRIARRYGTTAEKIKACNKGTIRNVNDITTGCYIYIPQ